MSVNTEPTSRLRIELQALARCLMPHKDNSYLRKATTLLLIGGWLAWSIGIDAGALTPGTPVMWGYTAYELYMLMTVYAFARLHDLEVKALLPVTDQRSDSDHEE